jgi:alkylation response protein AidB-like acyl-CoA dehydrogenase
VDLQLSEYQSLMVDSFRDFFARHATSEAVRAAEKSGGHDAGLWTRFVQLGGHALSLSEAASGGGGTLLDAVLVGFESGRRVAPIPYADTVAALRLVAAVSGALPSELVDGAVVTLAVPDGGSLRRGSDGRIGGRVLFTRAGAVADYLLALVDGEAILVALDGMGVERRTPPNLGRLPLASLELVGVEPAARWPLAESVRAAGRAESRVLAAAELVGAGRGTFDLVLDHVKSRKQFDRVIGSFQAIQHRLVDCHTSLDGAELLVLRAASYQDDPEALTRFSALALLRAREASEQAAKESLQFFGGYGFVVEYDVHLYLRFVKALGVLTGDDQVVDDALAGRVGDDRRGE